MIIYQVYQENISWAINQAKVSKLKVHVGVYLTRKIRHLLTQQNN